MKSNKHVLFGSKTNKQSGFAHLGLVVIALIATAAIGFAAWRVMDSSKKDSPKSVNDGSSQKADSKQESSGDTVSWSWAGNKWSPSSTPPACKEPLKFSVTPTETSLVSGILYPGQSRGGNYKPHGGFKLNTSSNTANVKAIMDGAVVSGARYIEGGEVQYMFTIVNDCGIAYRYDHLLELSPVFKELASTLPEAKVDDSRTTNFSKTTQVKAGDVIATAIGFKKTANYTFDLGVYDYRQQNSAAKNGKLGGVNLPDLSQAGYALCWLDMFEGADFSILPAVDATAGKTSDYCN